MKKYIFYLLLGITFSLTTQSAIAEEQGMWNKTKGVASDTWDGAKNVTSDVWDGAKKVTGDVWDGAKNVAGDVKDGITGNDTPNTPPQPHEADTPHTAEHPHSNDMSE